MSESNICNISTSVELEICTTGNQPLWLKIYCL